VNAPVAADEKVAARVTAATTTAFLVIAPVTSSSGWRVGLLIVAALALGHIAFHHGRHRLAGPMPLHFVVLYGLWALLATASLAWSADPGYTLAELRREVLYGALAFTVFFYAATSAGRLRLWGGALLAGTVALALFEIVRAHAAPGLAPWHGGPGRFSTHLALVAPFLLLLGTGPPEGFGRRAGLAGIAIACFGIAALDTHNRIVWASFLVALVTLAIAMAPVVTAPARRRLALGTILAAATLGALFALSLSQKLDVSYPTAASTTETFAMDHRHRLWAIAAEAIEERPLAGHGFGREVLERHYRERMSGTGYEFATHGHNLFLNAAVSLGAAGAALLAAMLAALALEHGRNLARPGTRVLGAIGLALVAAFLVKNLTDDFFNRHNALVFWALNGLLIGLGRRRGARA
jgi:O-antigen ligase